ncbi:uncharacterized protein LOC144797982 [Lissotriton helveticus]
MVSNHELLFGRKSREVPESRKRRIWEEIQHKVNAVGVTPRSVEDLRKRWYNLCLRSKEKLAARLEQSRITGGGTSSVSDCPPLEELVEGTLQPESVGGVADLDSSDQTASGKAPSSTQPSGSGTVVESIESGDAGQDVNTDGEDSPVTTHRPRRRHIVRPLAPIQDDADASGENVTNVDTQPQQEGPATDQHVPRSAARRRQRTPNNVEGRGEDSVFAGLELNMLQILKPALEKRRRDRINESLEKLRILLLESTRNPKFQNPKIEKVEILETAVQYLKNRTQMMKDGNLSGSLDATYRRHYLSGYKDCEQRLTNFIAKVHPSDENHLLDNLQMCVQANSWRATGLRLLPISHENYHTWSPHDPPGAFYSQLFQEHVLAKLSELHIVPGASRSPNSIFELPQPCSSICLCRNDQLPVTPDPRSCPADCTEQSSDQEQLAWQKDNPLLQTIWRPWP